MKITKSQLKQIIKEEMAKVLNEAGKPGSENELEKLWNSLPTMVAAETMALRKDDRIKGLGPLEWIDGPPYGNEGHPMEDDPLEEWKIFHEFVEDLPGGTFEKALETANRAIYNLEELVSDGKPADQRSKQVANQLFTDWWLACDKIFKSFKQTSV